MAEEVYRFNCPACGKGLKAPPGSTIKKTACPQCNTLLELEWCSDAIG